MKSLIIKGLYKSFPINKTQSFNALSNINLSFEEVGLVSIIGKSGSGKTTLLNMINKFDKPTKGEIFLYKQKYTYKNKNKHLFYRDDIGMVPQQYNLLTNLTVIQNVMMPLLVSGYSKAKSHSKAIKLLEFVNIPKSLYESKASNLSGGESQRVAIARALIRNPKIILCDEPTGALDSENTKRVMELLTKISKSKLVIMVTHNLQIVKVYSDRIIEISDGKIINDYKNRKIDYISQSTSENCKGRYNWTSLFSAKNFLRRFKRNLFIITSLSISLIITNLVVGFINGKDQAIRESCYRQFDFGLGSLSKDEIVSDTGIVKLTKSIRPDIEEVKNNTKITELFNICPNFSAILTPNVKIFVSDSLIEDINYSPIYSFVDASVDRSLLSIGSLPNIDTLNEVVINRNCYDKLRSFLKIDPLLNLVNIKHKFESIYVNEYEEYITDYFEYDINCKIVGVIDELTYLNSPKIYYSYLAFESLTQEYVLNNLSTYYAKKITWYDRVLNADNHALISSYSYQLFLKDINYKNVLFDEYIFGDYSFNSPSLIISNSLIGFVNAAEYALFLFLAIGIIGSLLILMIISFTNYSEDRKISAILSSIGARDSDIEDIYVNENFYSGLISFILSLGISYPLSLLINYLIEKNISVHNIVQIPYLRFSGVPFFYPLIVFVSISLLIYFSTLLPIKFSKKRSLSLELKAND